jgi:nucleoside-diphosphate-sugar epimerase
MRRLLIVGCGDVALRAAPLLARRYRLYGLSHRPDQRPALRARGITPIAGDLDDRARLRRVAGVAHEILHLAPPPPRGCRDTRTAGLLAALGSRGSLPRRLVYISTSGVYGDCGGALVTETRRVRPGTDRARRRVDAERRLRAFQRRTGVKVSILRVPGIYAADRLPLARLKAGTPALSADQDGFSNHVHAGDLARICAVALQRGRTGRVYHAVDESELRMGDYFDAVADAFGLPRPPRVSWAVAQASLSPELLSFMGESRRLSGARLRKELGVRLRYPTVATALAELRACQGGGAVSGSGPRRAGASKTR